MHSAYSENEGALSSVCDVQRDVSVTKLLCSIFKEISFHVVTSAENSHIHRQDFSSLMLKKLKKKLNSVA
jgi:hypothetical protein